MATVTNFANAFETTLTADMLGTDLTAQVQTTDGAPSSPCYLVIDPHNDDKREYVLFDGGFTTTSFATTALGNRYLGGSAAASGITHAAGAIVRFAPVAQHFQDLHVLKADNADVVKLAGAQTVTGAKTFSVDPTLADGSSALSLIEGNAAYVPAKVANTATYGNDSTDATAHLQALFDAGHVYLPEGVFRTTASLTATVAGRRLWGPGTIKRAFNGPIIQVSAASVRVEEITLDGNTAGGFTGTGVEASTADDMHLDLDVVNTGGTCVEFTTAGASTRARVSGKLVPASGSPAVKLPAANESVSGRRLIDIVTQGGILADFGGCGHIIVSNCNVLRLGTFTSSSKKVQVSNTRIASGGLSDTLYGSDHVLTGNLIGGDLTIDSTALSCTVVGNEAVGTITNNSASSLANNNVHAGRNVNPPQLVGARAKRTTSYSLANNTVAAIPLETTDFDKTGISGTVHWDSANPARLTCRVGGTYTISGSLDWAANSTGERQNRIVKNGVTILAKANVAALAGSMATQIQTIVQLSAGDYIELHGYQNSGGALDVAAGWTWLAMALVGQ